MGGWWIKARNHGELWGGQWLRYISTVQITSAKPRGVRLTTFPPISSLRSGLVLHSEVCGCNPGSDQSQRRLFKKDSPKSGKILRSWGTQASVFLCCRKMWSVCACLHLLQDPCSPPTTTKGELELGSFFSSPLPQDSWRFLFLFFLKVLFVCLWERESVHAHWSRGRGEGEGQADLLRSLALCPTTLRSSPELKPRVVHLA